MMEPNIEDKFLTEMLRKSAGPMPFSDFEDELMLHIKANEKGIRMMRRDLKLSWLFFSLGMIAGMLLLVILPEWKNYSGGIDGVLIARTFLVIGFFLVFFIFARNLHFLTKRYKR